MGQVGRMAPDRVKYVRFRIADLRADEPTPQHLEGCHALTPGPPAPVPRGR